MIAIEKEIIGADPETGKPIIRAFIVSSETPAELPTDGSTVDNLADDEKLGVFSILYVVADSSVYIANEAGEFVLQSSGGGGGGGGDDPDDYIINVEAYANDGLYSFTPDKTLDEVMEWMGDILNTSNDEEEAVGFISQHLKMRVHDIGGTMPDTTLAYADMQNIDFDVTESGEFIQFSNDEVSLYYYYYRIVEDEVGMATRNNYDGYAVKTSVPWLNP